MIINSEDIKKKAIDLGFHKVGIAKASQTKKEEEQLNQWLNNNKHATMEWIEKRKSERGNIFNYFSEAKSVISLGMNYYVGKDQSDLDSNFKFSNYAWGDDYHSIIKSKLFELLKFIKEPNPGVKGLVCVDTAPVMEKVWAQRAGLGWQGKHTNLVSRNYGSWLFLGIILTNIYFRNKTKINSNCGTCSKCIEVCPTQAIIKPYSLDARRCISYLTIEHKTHIQKDFRIKIGNRIFGCDDCLAICPWNKFSKKSQELKYSDRIIDNLDLNELAQLDENQFKKLFN